MPNNIQDKIIFYIDLKPLLNKATVIQIKEILNEVFDHNISKSKRIPIHRLKETLDNHFSEIYSIDDTNDDTNYINNMNLAIYNILKI